MSKTVFIKHKDLPPKLFVVIDRKIRVFDLIDQMTVGRNTVTKKNDIDLVYNFVSRQHGRFTKSENIWYFTDMYVLIQHIVSLAKYK